eukprot:PhF_6_TR31328/c0_g1_i1/m.45866
MLRRSSWRYTGITRALADLLCHKNADRKRIDQENLAGLASASVLRNLRDSTFFSTRQTINAKGNTLNSSTPVLSTTLRRLDKAVKRAADLERLIEKSMPQTSSGTDIAPGR